MTFPKNFVWGAATSAYQIEGAAREDGRGPSIWDEFCRRPGAVRSGHSGDMACNHYHRYREDVSLMQEIGLQAYRFSISWPRVLPEGTGAVNTAGLDFYDRLTDALLAAGITPYATLFHWDYPLALHTRGGWLHPDSPAWFARYAEVVVDRLSDRIHHWLTLNEPQICVGFGYQDGTHAPGQKLELAQVLGIGHNMLLAHGRAVQAIRSCARNAPSVGCAFSVNPVAVPASGTDEDIEAARRAFFSADRPLSSNNSWWTDPVVLGRYPQDGMTLFADALPAKAADAMATISQPLDFLGLNVYFGETYRAGRGGTPEKVPLAPDHQRTSMHWPVMPESLYWACKFFQERYGLPVIVSENGMASEDVLTAGGEVHDDGRIDFLCDYLGQLKRACAEGVDVRGYFVWSLMDNFEWAEGYGPRFGLLYVDYPTQRRVVKKSACWYEGVISSNGAEL